MKFLALSLIAVSLTLSFSAEAKKTSKRRDPAASAESAQNYLYSSHFKDGTYHLIWDATNGGTGRDYIAQVIRKNADDAPCSYAYPKLLGSLSGQQGVVDEAVRKELTTYDFSVENCPAKSEDQSFLSVSVQIYSYVPGKVVSFTVTSSDYEMGAAHPNSNGYFITKFLDGAPASTISKKKLGELVMANLTEEQKDASFDAESSGESSIKSGGYAYDRSGNLSLTIGLVHAAGDFDYFKIPRAQLEKAGIVPFAPIQVAN